VKSLAEAEVQKAVELANRMLIEGNAAGARDTLRTIVLSEPPRVEAMAQYGAAAYLAGDPAEARRALSRAVQMDPNHVAAHKYLAGACLALGNFTEFDWAARTAARLDPRDHECLNLHGIACMNRLQVDEAASSFSAAVDLAPNEIGALVNLEHLSSRSLQHRRTLERSPKISAVRAQAIDRLQNQYRSGQLNDEGLRSLLLLLAGAQETFAAAVELARDVACRKEFSSELADQIGGMFLAVGDLAEGLRFRRMVAEQSPSQPLALRTLASAGLLASYNHWQEKWEALVQGEEHTGAFAGEVPRWTGQPLEGKKILVYQEQGIGDAILALRTVPLLAARGIRFDLWVRPPLAGLAASLRGYEKLIRSQTRPDARTLGCEYASTLFGLIAALGASHEELIKNPTLLAPSQCCVPEARARVRALPGRRIGLAYGGNPDRRDAWFRDLPPAALKPLAEIQGVSWVSLVFDRRPDRAEVLRMLRMSDPMEEAKTFEDTAAIISELDAIIAIDSSTAHLAASLGKPLWVLVPPMLDWRWQIGDDTKPWWPSASVLRSPSPGVWESVIEELAREVRGDRQSPSSVVT
jgi:tetratricopeptide (TPR) repeat protein